jgi:hypothetical protein
MGRYPSIVPARLKNRQTHPHLQEVGHFQEVAYFLEAPFAGVRARDTECATIGGQPVYIVDYP